MSDQQPPFGPPQGPPPGQPGQSPYGPPPSAPQSFPQNPQGQPVQPGQQPFHSPPGQPPNQPPPGVDYAGFGGYGGPGGPGGSAGQKPRNTKKWLIGGGSVVAAAALIGGGAFAAASLMGGSDGPGPADALPASTFAYAGFDLSHLGDAFTMLAKFPAATKDSTLNGVITGGGDPREKLVKAILDSDDSCGLTWEKDFQPWLGQKAAVAGVDVKDSPTPVVVLEVKDAGAAKSAFGKFDQCGDGDDAAYSIKGDWALLGENQDAINEIAKEASSSSLSDDSDYKKWTGEVGDPGLVTLYASPKAGQELSAVLKKYPNALGELAGGGSAIASSSGASSSDPAEDPFGDSSDNSGFGAAPDPFSFCPGLLGNTGGAAGSYEKYLSNFGGAAATLRFDNGGAELETAADFGKTSSVDDEAGSLVKSLPDDTAVAVGTSVGDNAFESALDGLGSICGSGFDAKSLEDQLSQMTGLDFPTDIDTLLGNGLTISLGKDFDPSSIHNPADLPVALKINGDPDKIQQVIDKIKGRLGSASSLLGTDTDSDNIAIGPNDAYRKSVLADGGLGSDATFKNVVPHADKASAVVYVNFNDFDKLVGSGEDAENFKVLDGLGMSAWYDGTTQHSFTRLSTD